jgi:RecB family exonuclease
VVFSGRTDLALGRADGSTARKVIIDLKTGSFSAAHLDDLRFYALIETLRLGTPPRLMASYYLDAGRAQPEAVTEGLLRAAAARAVDGARALHELSVGTRAPVARPGYTCRWCPALDTCQVGQVHLGRADDASPFDAD